MAISINCATKVISVPLADLTLVSAGVYSLDVEDFRIWLKDWEDSEVGMGMPDTHRRNAPVTLSGTTYAQTFEIINGYSVLFENGSYRVRVLGGNHNIADVMNANSVSIEIGNSAGLVRVETGVSGLTTEESALLTSIAGIPASTLALILASVIKANVKQVNDIAIKGAGVPGNTWGPA